MKKIPWYFGVAVLLMVTVSATGLTQEILLRPVQKDTPYFDRKKENEYGAKYFIKAVKIKDNPDIASGPDTQAAVLYYGKIKLGNPTAEYGILIDFEGKEKKLWVDSNGDKNFAGETAYLVFKNDSAVGGNIYYSPTPLLFLVKTTVGDHSFNIPLQMDLLHLVIVRLGFEDYLTLKTRTWLNAVFEDQQDERRLALVDSNDNGVFNDPDDLIYVDNNYDLTFIAKESKKQRAFKSLKLKFGKYRVNYSSVPQKLILEKGK